MISSIIQIRSVNNLSISYILLSTNICFSCDYLLVSMLFFNYTCRLFAAWLYIFIITPKQVLYARFNKFTQTFSITTYERKRKKITSIRPSPPGPDESDPERSSLYQQRCGEVGEHVVVKHSQTGVVRQTSVDCCEPINSLSVNLVTRRLVYKSVIATRHCNTSIYGNSGRSSKVLGKGQRQKSAVCYYGKGN